MRRRSKEFREEMKAIRARCTDVNSLYRRLNFSPKEGWDRDINSALGRFDLLILGKYNAGKSSLLNLLLSLHGAEGLPTHIRPTTRHFWKIGYARSCQLKGLCFTESKALFSRHGKLSEILRELDSEEGKELCKYVDLFELGLPVEWLKETGWFFWDSPGEDDPEKWLDHGLLHEALRRCDAVLLATSFDQHADCAKYIQQASNYNPGCFIVVLTNSANRELEEFFNSSGRHMEVIRANLESSLTEPALFAYVDSNRTKDSLNMCGESSREIQNVIGRWRSGAASSKQSFIDAVSKLNEAARMIELGGLFDLWQTFEKIHEIEEMVISSRVWSAVARSIQDAEVRATENVTAARSLYDEAKQSQNLLENRSKPQFSKMSAKELAESIESLIGNAQQTKAKRARTTAKQILQQKLRLHEPGAMTKVLRTVSFNTLGGSLECDNEEFQSDLAEALKNEAVRFVAQSIWPILQDTVQDAFRHARGNLEHQFSQQIGHPIKTDNLPIDFAPPSDDDLAQVMEKVGKEIMDILFDLEIRSTEEKQEEFLDAVEKAARNISKEMIMHAAHQLRHPLDREIGELKSSAAEFLQNEIEQGSTRCTELESSVRSHEEVLAIAVDLRTACEENANRHRQSILRSINIP